jgi:hypothetical protein
MRSKTIATILSRARARLVTVERSLESMERASSQGLGTALRARREGWPESADELRHKVAPCFVLSPGRSGTMTLSAVLATSNRIHAEHEPAPALVAASFLAYLHGDRDLPEDFWRRAMAQARDPLVIGAHRRGRVYVESNNRLTLLAGALSAQYPRARFLLLTRHPFDFVASAMARRYYRGHGWDFARLIPRPGDPDATAWPAMSAIERCAWLWSRTYELALKHTDSLPSDQSLILKAEDLFENRHDVVDRIFHFILDRDAESPRRVRRVLGKVLNRQRQRSGAGRREAWSEAERQQVRARTAALMDRLGYE